MKRLAVSLMVVGLALSGCAVRRADQLYAGGDYAAAIDAYESLLVRRAELSARDAPTLMNLAMAYSAPESARLDLTRAEHYLRLVHDLFPKTRQAREAKLALESIAAVRRAGELAAQLEERDEQVTHLRAVLQSVAQAENRLRGEVESKDEATADLEGRVAILTRRARTLTKEIAALQSELDALKQIDLETVTNETDPP